MPFSGRLLHTMLHVTDLERSVDFYVRLMGMRELRRGSAPAEGRQNAFVGYGEEATTAVIELTQLADRPQLEHGTAFGHIAIGTADVAAAAASLTAQGVAMKKPPFTLPNGLVIAFLEDPDGYEIELVERP